MPTMDGFEFMREYKEYKKLPINMQKGKIVILSSSNDPKDLKTAKELGYVDYVVKPLTTNKLNKVVKQLVNVLKIEH